MGTDFDDNCSDYNVIWQKYLAHNLLNFDAEDECDYMTDIANLNWHE